MVSRRDTDSTRRGLDTMTHGRMQTMTQGRDGISLVRAVALKFKGVARQLSVVTVMLAIAALLTSTAGTSYAKSKSSPSDALRDTVVVTNFGSSFGGSIETFREGSRRASPPEFWIKGPNTLLGFGGPVGVDVSSFDDHIAVTVPIDLL